MHRMAAKSVATAAAASSPRWRPFSVALCYSGGRPALAGSFPLQGQNRFYSRQYKVSKGVAKAIRGHADMLLCFKPDKISKVAAKASKKVKELKLHHDEVHHSHISWWKERMEMCRKPSTLQLVKRLVYSNLLGLDVNLKNGSLKEGNLNMELLQFKSKFPREVLLCRVGEFYEAVGFDACILVEHAGLNPFGGLRTDSIPRAGCPVVNLRQTLDDLTRASYSVCIVEEVQGPTQARSRKGRFISGHAHPGCPYLFGLAELAHDVEFPEPMPVVGISRSARGYCMVSILETMKTFSAEDGLTEDALVMKLRTSHYHHLFLHASLRQNVSGTSRWGEFGEGGLLWAECHRRYFEWFDGDPTQELILKVRELYGLDDKVSFRNVTIASEKRPRPLYLGTATQIGVIPTEGIPSLLRVILPSTCTGLPVMYLRDLILNPPPYSIASKIQGACRLMSDVSCSIPDFTCISSAKLVKLLESKEASHIEFSRIKNAVEEILLMHKNMQLNGVLNMLLDPTWAATGLKVDYETLVYECELVSQRIGEIIYLHDEINQSTTSSSLIPDEFFENMESSWKGRVKRVHVEDVFIEAESAADNLIKVVTEDFLPIITRIKAVMSPLGGPKGEVAYSREHDAVWFRGKRFTPSVWSGTPGEEQIKRLKPALDSRGRKVGEEWFTTERVENALNRYREMCDKARIKVIMLLRDLSAELQGKINLLIFTSMLLIISKALFCHVSEGRRRKWVIPTLVEFKVDNNLRTDATKMNLLGLSPYWFNEARGNAIKNSVDMSSLFLLTGPNGGGKSSLLRSICAAALLGMCGLMVPAESATIPHFDSVMLHVKSYDSPADGKSSFQIEMSEIRSIITEATSRSLILMDEICRGTEMIKGTCIAGSIIENLDQTECLGVVSTHLHDIFNLPLNVKNIVYKAMGTEIVDGQTKPTWRLIDGICRESLAFETAEKEGIPELIIRRAQELYKTIPKEGLRAADNSEFIKFVQDPIAHYLDKKSDHGRAAISPICFRNDIRSKETFQSDVEVAVATICGKRLEELYRKKVISDRVEVTCVKIGLREQPPPSAIGASCVYVIFRPDKKLYVGQTDDIIGRVGAHRSKDSIENLHFLYFLVPGKSLASELETLLINQLPARGFQLVNKADGNHRNFGTLSMHVENVKTTA